MASVRTTSLGIYRDIFEDHSLQPPRRHRSSDGDCVLDVSANTGLFVLYLNTLCRHARVYAFEPVPAIFGILFARNIEVHNHLDVRLFNVGLSSRSYAPPLPIIPASRRPRIDRYPDRSSAGGPSRPGLPHQPTP